MTFDLFYAVKTMLRQFQNFDIYEEKRSILYLSNDFTAQKRSKVIDEITLLAIIK